MKALRFIGDVLSGLYDLTVGLIATSPHVALWVFAVLLVLAWVF